MAIDFKNQTPKNTLPANGVIFGADDPNSTSPSTYTKSALVDPNVVKSISGGTTGLTPSVPTNGDVVISGTLAVANGGTGVTTKTGTGSVVLSDNPTLVSPVLGTPASGDLTNCTNLPLTTGITGVLDETHGGTGQSNYTIGDLLYASSTTALSKLPDAATGNALISGGVGAPPLWGKVGLTTHVDGTLPVANGGTGVTTLPALQAAVLPSQGGNAGKYLQTNGSTASWALESTSYYDNISALKGAIPTSGRFAEVGGYYTVGDGGGGQFYGATGASPGTYVDNGGTVIVPTGGNGSAAWLLSHDKIINAKQFGTTNVAPQSSSGSVTITAGTNTLTFSNSVFALSDVGKKIYIPGIGASGNPLITTITEYTSPTSVKLQNNATFAQAAVTFTGSISGSGNARTLTVSSITGRIYAGMQIFWSGLGTTVIIRAFVSGINGGNGNYSVSVEGSLVNPTSIAMTGETAIVWGDNDTAQLNNLFTALQSGWTVNLQGLNYFVTSSVNIQSKQNFVINGTNATIKVADKIPLNSGTSACYLEQCSNFTVSDVTFDANRTNRTTSYTEPGSASLFARNIDYFVFNDCKFINAPLDGVYLSVLNEATQISKYGEFNNCIADNNWRNGVSVINGAYINFNGGYYIRTNGAPAGPLAGVDIEANAGAVAGVNNNINFNDVTFAANGWQGVQVSNTGSPKNINFNNCVFTDTWEGVKVPCKQHLTFCGLSGSAVDCTFDGITNTVTRGVVDFASTATPFSGEFLLLRPTFINNTATAAATLVYLIYVHSSSAVTPSIYGLSFDTAPRILYTSAPGTKFINPIQMGSTAASQTTLLDGAIAITSGAKNSIISGINASKFYRNLIIIGAPDCIIRDCVLEDNVSNDPAGMIRLFSGPGSNASGITISNIVMRLTTLAAGYGLTTNSAARRMDNIWTDGFTFAANAFNFSGSAASDAVVYRSALSVNGTRFFYNQTAVADPAGGATIDTECRTQLIALLTQLRALGTIP